MSKDSLTRGVGRCPVSDVAFRLHARLQHLELNPVVRVLPSRERELTTPLSVYRHSANPTDSSGAVLSPRHTRESFWPAPRHGSECPHVPLRHEDLQPRTCACKALPLMPRPRFPAGGSSPQSKIAPFLPAVTSLSLQPRHLETRCDSSSCDPCPLAGS